MLLAYALWVCLCSMMYVHALFRVQVPFLSAGASIAWALCHMCPLWCLCAYALGVLCRLRVDYVIIFCMHARFQQQIRIPKNHSFKEERGYVQFLGDLCRSRLWIVGPDKINRCQKVKITFFAFIILYFAKYLKSCFSWVVGTVGILHFAKYLNSCFSSVVGTVDINHRPTSHKYIAISTGTVTTIVVNIYDTILLLDTW